MLLRIISSARQFSYNHPLFPELTALSQPLKVDITQELYRQSLRCGNVVREPTIHKCDTSNGRRGMLLRIISSARQFSYNHPLFPELAALSQPLKVEITQELYRQFLRCGNVVRDPTIHKCDTSNGSSGMLLRIISLARQFS
ncbi:hypothetical protein AVEN_183428-1 [Araneus ventricosus]|uniref:Uncharacterized protein n=1 Tax=Araneus ventricosus TaxID=182803 RepID=A0A4Y2PQH4_ARAVE|nr:hypothetical protein AVEN_183428-1 [Araneus ventricosus]